MLGIKALKEWCKEVTPKLNAGRGGLADLKLTAKLTGPAEAQLLATIRSRTIPVGKVDLMHGIVTERINGVLDHPDYTVIIPNVSGALAA